MYAIKKSLIFVKFVSAIPFFFFFIEIKSYVNPSSRPRTQIRLLSIEISIIWHTLSQFANRDLLVEGVRDRRFRYIFARIENGEAFTRFRNPAPFGSISQKWTVSSNDDNARLAKHYVTIKIHDLTSTGIMTELRVWWEKRKQKWFIAVEISVERLIPSISRRQIHRRV